MENDSRTEPATAKRRLEERKKGNVARSPEFSTSLILLSAFLLISFSATSIIDNLSGLMAKILTSAPEKYLSFEYLKNAGSECALVFVKTVGPFLLAAATIGIVANIAQVRFIISFEHLKQIANRFNIVKGLKKFFTLNSLVALAKNLLKLVIISAISYRLLSNEISEIFMYTGRGPSFVISSLIGIITRLGNGIALIMIVIAVLDYIYQKKQFEKSIMMTKQEVKQEHKQHEGDPLFKSKRKSKQLQMSRNRMIAMVPDSDVVITNPTMYAVALKYDQDYNAPQVIAKGIRLIAKNIKKIALKHNVPIVENKLVAQTIYKSVEVGQEVPPVLYKAVAEILAYVYKLKNKTMGKNNL